MQEVATEAREPLDKNRNQRSTSGGAGDDHLPQSGAGSRERARSAQALPAPISKSIHKR